MSVALIPRRQAKATIGVTRRDAATTRLLARPVYALAVLKLGVTLAFAGQYGFHRDELYYLASGQHPSLGYVDYPPVTPLLARLDTMIFGTGLVTLRLLPVLAGALIVILGGLIARELGGGQKAQMLAAFGVLVSGIYLGGDWLFETVVFDQLMWALTIFLLVRLLRTRDQRLWPLVGLAFGVGLETKYTILALGLGVLVGLVATRDREQLKSVWPWVAAAIALALLAPNLIWQAQHDWASLSFLDVHHTDDTSRLSFVLEQLLFVNIFLLPLVAMGVRWLFQQEAFRVLAWIPIVVEVALFIAGGKSYYATPMFVLLYAAGAVAIEPYLSRGNLRARMAMVMAPATLLILVLLPIALPVLPAKVMARTKLYKLRDDYGNMTGWPEFVRTIAGVYHGLPPAERRHTQILMGNYGEAGAIDLFGPRYHLPQALSGHLTFYYWKPRHVVAQALIMVEINPASLNGECRSIRRVATIRNSLGVQNEENGNPVLLCRGNIDLDPLWHKQQHFD